MRVLIRLLVVLGLLLSASSLSPLATATADPSGTPSPSSGSPDPGSPSGSASEPATGRPAGPSTSPSAARRTRTRSTAATEPLQTTITSTGALRRLRPITVGRATFRYRANAPAATGVLFQCKLNGPAQDGRWGACPIDGGAGPEATGSKGYVRLTADAGAYTFTVQAYRPEVRLPSGTVTPREEGTEAPFSWYIYSLFAPARYLPRGGATFNNPLGDRTHLRTNLTHVIRTINSMPGYRQPYADGAPCRRVVLSRIRISLYSMTDQPVAKALVNAARRCVSVQILMNNHLNSANDPAWHRVEAALRPNVRSNGVDRPSFAHRCSYGCQGSGVLHTKMYLFDSDVPAPNTAWNKINNTVMVGSSNMTFNAAKVQWNDLYTVRGNRALFNQYQAQFSRMKRDNGFHRARTVTTGGYRTTFWPTTAGSDPELGVLRSVRCAGANGGTGIRGRSVVYINMHAWFGTRGLTYARQVRRMYNRGCYVRVLYSFMSFGVFKILKRGTGSRMTVRRTLFSKNGKTASLYSHYKNIAISGYVGGDRSSKLVTTGSNNFTDDGTHFDEVMMRISSASAYAQYTRQWNFMRVRKSASTYANFSEPTGGGRAPKPKQALANATLVSPDAPTITSPDVVVNEEGTPKALD